MAKKSESTSKHIDASEIKDIHLVKPCYIRMRDGTVYDFESEALPGEQWDEWLKRCGKKRED